MIFVVKIIQIAGMVSIVFVSRVTMVFVMLFAINAKGLLQYCEIYWLYCICGGPIWEKSMAVFYSQFVPDCSFNMYIYILTERFFTEAN